MILRPRMETDKQNGKKLVESPYDEDFNALLKVCATVKGVTPAELHHQLVVKMDERVKEGMKLSDEDIADIFGLDNVFDLIKTMLKTQILRDYFVEALQKQKCCNLLRDAIKNLEE